jgi:hypothetical protein
MSEHREPQWFLDASLLIIGPLLVALLVCWFFSPIWFSGIRE